MARTLAMFTDRVLGRGPFVFPYRRGTIGVMRTQFQLRAGRLEEMKGDIVREQPRTVYVDGERFLTPLCSPFNPYAAYALDLPDAS